MSFLHHIPQPRLAGLTLVMLVLAALFAPSPSAHRAMASSPVTFPVNSAVKLESFNYSGLFLRHQNGLGELTALVSDLDRSDATFVIRPGLATDKPGSVTLESVNYPHQYLRHQSGRLKLSPDDGTPLMHSDASFFVRLGLSVTTYGGYAPPISLESVNYPGNYIRHRDAHLWVENSSSNPATFLADATFRFSSVPSAHILSPQNGAVINNGQAISFQAQATDHDDGVLAGASIAWYSDRDGFLGTGATLTRVLSSANPLCMPEFVPHTITLRATDRDGHQVTDHVNVFVGGVC